MSGPDTSETQAALAKLLERIAGEIEATAPLEPETGPERGVEPLLYEFLRSFLLWESTEVLAEEAMDRLEGGIVDCNEIRIFLPGELSEIIGVDYPRSMERSLRLGSALNEVYEREHDVNLERLAEKNKREARSYLLSLEGVPPFVASRMMLLCLGGHAFPIDDRLRKLLTSEGILKKKDSVASATNRMERLIRSGDAQKAYLAIERWAQTKPLPQEKRTSRKASTRVRPTSTGQD